MELF